MRKEIVYPGNSKQPCVAEYEIKHESINYINHAKVMIYDLYENNPGGTSIGFPGICEYLVNRILQSDFNGVRLDFIEFYYIWRGNDEDIVSEIRYSIDSLSFTQDGGKHNSVYFSIFRRIKAWLVSRIARTSVPDHIEVMSKDVTAGIGRVRITNDPRFCISRKGG